MRTRRAGRTRQWRASCRGRARISTRVLGQLKKQTPGPARNRLLERGALLHADIARLSPRRLSDSGPALFKDGHVVGHLAGTVHWDFGRALLDNLTPEPSSDDWARLWYHVTAAVMQLESDYSDLEPHLLHALRIFPDDPVLLLDAGTMQEAYAGPRIQSVLARMARDAPPGAATTALPVASTGFVAAVTSGVQPVASASTRRPTCRRT